MSYYANNSERARFIVGLYELAEFLKANKDVPAPRHTAVLVFPFEIDDEANRLEIDRIAALIGSIPEGKFGEHYVASRSFGSVEYRAVAIPADEREA